ncbi:MAG: S41 family peptidase [Culicoidibacterales bacterium]
MNNKKQFTMILFIAVIITAILTWAINNYIVYGLTDETTAKYRIATQRIQRNSLKPVDDIILQEGSIRGMVDSLKDPHSAYLTAEQVNVFESVFASEYTGIGITTTKIISGFMVLEVAKNSPAEAAGLKVNDIVIEINNVKVDQNELTISDYLKKTPSVKMLKIKRGTEEKVIELTEAVVDYASSISQIMIVNGEKVLVFNLKRFTDKTVELMTKDLEKLQDTTIKKVIFDLRNNTGSSVQIAEQILRKTVSNKKNFMTIEKKNEESVKFISDNPNLVIKQPTVLLVNEKTASSAEIVVAAFNQIEGIPIVGNKTFGKSSIQELFKMNDGSALKLTTQRWIMPDGGVLTDGQGIEPNHKTIDSLPYTISTIGATKEFSLGDRDSISSSTISEVQMMLNYFGYDTSRADGLFDERTRNQLIAFQGANQIESTGKIDMNTLFIINGKLISYTSDLNNDITLQKGLAVVSQ